MWTLHELSALSLWAWAWSLFSAGVYVLQPLWLAWVPMMTTRVDLSHDASLLHCPVYALKRSYREVTGIWWCTNIEAERRGTNILVCDIFCPPAFFCWQWEFVLQTTRWVVSTRFSFRRGTVPHWFSKTVMYVCDVLSLTLLPHVNLELSKWWSPGPTSIFSQQEPQWAATHANQTLHASCSKQLHWMFLSFYMPSGSKMAVCSILCICLSDCALFTQ